MWNALLEIGCEEIPARFMPGFLADLKKTAEEKLARERLTFAAVKTLGTARRLTLFIEGLAPQQPDLTEEMKGPPADFAFDKSGKPTQAAIGFAKSQGSTVENLELRAVGGKNYVFVKITRKGKPAEQVLASLFPEIISALYQPLSMRWGDLDFKFIRPIHWIVSLYGSKVVKFEVAGVTAGNMTEGQRYFGTSNLKPQTSKQIRNPKFKIPMADLISYKKLLLKLRAVVDQDERRKMIKKQVGAAAGKVKAVALVEDDLLDEVTFLVENPLAYVGRFNPEFLAIPQDVLITSMKKNQKYFPLLDKAGKLVAKFVVVTDGCKNAAVVDGNEKVLSARLADAKFFFDEDKKQPLKMRAADLAKVGFFEKLGTLAQKTERVTRLAEWIGKRLGLSEGEAGLARRIAELSKADLTTKMVYEFPELQGVIGREYALLSGENPKVAAGIYEHYLPRFAEDKLPASRESLVVALADRLDTLVGCFAAGAAPTGSADPYGLRRAANGIISIIRGRKADLLLDETLEHAYKLYAPVFSGGSYKSFAQVKQLVVGFIAGRLRPLLLEEGIRHDVVDAVLADFNDILDVAEKTRIISKVTGESWFPGIVLSADRVARIAREVKRDEVIEADLEEAAEKDLFKLYLRVNWEVGEAAKKEDWLDALKSLTLLTDQLEIFFDKVLVMHKDERLKANRLALLKTLRKLYLSVADFALIVLQ